MKPGTKVAASDATRRSQAQANESPAPAAAPFTAAMTGFWSERMRRTFGWYVCSSASSIDAGDLAELLQVLSGAEPLPRAGDDDAPDRRRPPPPSSASCRAAWRSRLNAL